MTSTTTKVAELKKMADELAAREILVETNEGTYSGLEAQRAIGTGSPQFADYRVYETIGSGARRHVGCDPKRAPGRARHFREEIASERARLAELRQEIKAAR